MDDLRDPRELGLDPGEEFGQLSDEERHQESPAAEGDDDLKRLEEEEAEALRKIEEIRQRKERLRQETARKIKVKAETQVNRTPSPKKPKRQVEYAKEESQSKRPSKSISQKLQEASRDEHNSTYNDPKASAAPSYFIQKLAESNVKREQEKQHRRALINSRVYTFDSTLEIEPKVVDEKEYYSGHQISRRYVDGEKLKEFFKDKKVMRLPKLFAKVVEPDFLEPQYPNWAVVGIISKKSPPKPTSDGKSKFMQFTLTDFKINLAVTLFGKAVEKYNKFRLGDIIAILNPGIYVKLEAAGGPNGAGFRTFQLSIKHDGDSILEIGRAKFYGNCPSQKKDGTICSQPINTEIEECCSYHKELRIRKTAGQRMEFQTSVRQVSPTRNGRKQEMLLGKPDNRGGWSSSRVVTNEVAPANDRISRAEKFFSSTNKHQAFFNSEVNDVQDIKKKKLKQDLYKKRLKEIELQKKLHESIQGAKNLKKLGTVKVASEDREMTLEEKRALLKYAYGGKGLMQLGFDPTAKGSSKGLLAMKDEEQKRQASQTAAELSELAKKRKIDLSVSEEVLDIRRKQLKDADETLKRIKKEKFDSSELAKLKIKRQVQGDPKQPRAVTQGLANTNKEALELSDLSESDSDLEIVDISMEKCTSSFERFKQHQKVKREDSV